MSCPKLTHASAKEKQKKLLANDFSNVCFIQRENGSTRKPVDYSAEVGFWNSPLDPNPSVEGQYWIGLVEFRENEVIPSHHGGRDKGVEFPFPPSYSPQFQASL